MLRKHHRTQVSLETVQAIPKVLLNMISYRIDTMSCFVWLGSLSLLICVSPSRGFMVPGYTNRLPTPLLASTSGKIDTIRDVHPRESTFGVPLVRPSLIEVSLSVSKSELPPPERPVLCLGPWLASEVEFSLLSVHGQGARTGRGSSSRFSSLCQQSL